MERHRAVVAGPDADPRAVEDLGDVVGMDARQVERDHPAAQLGGRAVQLDAGHVAPQRLERVRDQVALVVADAVHPELVQVLGRDAQPDRGGDVRRARLELPGDVVELGPAQLDLADHVAAGEERRHRLEQLAPAPRARPSRWAPSILCPEKT